MDKNTIFVKIITSFMKKFIALLAAALVAMSAFADEGMWLLPLIQKLNKSDLNKAGCKVSPAEIYHASKSSLKDAVVQFGGGCTAEVISSEGLLVTNHHCGYGYIQAMSTKDNNYLMNGYWALSREDEIPVRDLKVTFLKYMEDITPDLDKVQKKAMKNRKLKNFPEKILQEVQKKQDQLVMEARKNNENCDVDVVSFYNDNVKYLIVTKTYTDIRFVGAPPASVGKFGGETDNWMWPRHTGDFSMFRIYASPSNEPAEFSPENVPYRTENPLKISLHGVKEGDYAMILGYPGRTQRYQTAAQLEQMIANNRIRINARTVRQDLMWKAMIENPDVRLKYASKYAGSANGWKKWQGEELSFKKLDIIGRQQKKEETFSAWAALDPAKQNLYGSSISQIEEAVNSMSAPYNALTLLSEAPMRVELVGFAASLRRELEKNRVKGAPSAEEREKVLLALEDAYRDYYEPLDRDEAMALLMFYQMNADEENLLKNLGGEFDTLESLNISEYVDWLFSTSAFTSHDKLASALKADPNAVLNNDPAIVLLKRISEIAERLSPKVNGVRTKLAAASKSYAAGLLEWQKGKAMYPDANFTMRFTYGHVRSYSPRDAVIYKYFSTHNGILEKENPEDPEFEVPETLKDLLKSREFGQYSDVDGQLHTCFLTDNDITGGNSGSPVLNARGELIGLAFDGNWESMSSDVMFEPNLQRTICVDIRYVLFLVEKLGGATNIINEISFSAK